MGNVNAKYCKKSFTFVLLKLLFTIYYAKWIGPNEGGYQPPP